ncbi:DUF4019 domain-containing protein [Calditrichota bacterium]
MKYLFSLLFLSASVICFSCDSKETPKETANTVVAEKTYTEVEKEAIVAAEAWLKLIDSEQYEKSWDESAELFQNAIGKEDWASTVKGVRSKYGKLKKRELMSAKYTTTIPGGPDGEYVVIHFVAKLEQKDRAVETVTPLKGDDGKWHVSGYFIK